jgi:hypothetical protein
MRYIPSRLYQSRARGQHEEFEQHTSIIKDQHIYANILSKQSYIGQAHAYVLCIGMGKKMTVGTSLRGRRSTGTNHACKRTPSSVTIVSSLYSIPNDTGESNGEGFSAGFLKGIPGAIGWYRSLSWCCRKLYTTQPSIPKSNHTGVGTDCSQFIFRCGNTVASGQVQTSTVITDYGHSQ